MKPPANKNPKRYIIRKYIMAKSASEAIKKEHKHVPDDVWVDEDWKKEKGTQLESCVGFDVYNED